MSLKVTQKGKLFHVEDTCLSLVKAKFDNKEDAISFAKQEVAKQRDYMSQVSSNISISSIDMNI